MIISILAKHFYYSKSIVKHCLGLDRYRFANMFGRYQYIGICKLDIGLGHISISISIGFVDIGYISIS